MAWAAAAPALISAAGSIAGGLLSQQGQNSANAANASLNQENMVWQEHMSDTAVMRRKQDMINAGINPILAAGNPASQPSYSPIPMQNPNAQLGQAIGGAAQSAAAVANSMADTKLKQATAASVQANTPSDINTPAKTDAQYILKSTAEQIRAQTGLTEANAEQVKAATANIVAQLPGLEAQSTSAQATAKWADQQQALQAEATRIANALNSLKTPEAQAAAQFWQTAVGKATGAAPAATMIRTGLMLLKELLGK